MNHSLRPKRQKNRKSPTSSIPSWMSRWLPGGSLFSYIELLLISVVFASCSNPPRNLKLVTYNVQQSSPNSHDGKYYDENGNPLDDEERASLIANRIKGMDADVVVLNEVFDEDSREIF